MTNQAYAQKFRVGLATGFGLENADGETGLGFGVNAGYVASFKENLRYAADLTFYMPSSNDTDVLGTTFSTSIIQFEGNANTNYVFITKDAMELYGIGGLQYAYKTATAKAGGSSSTDTDSAIGLNVGAGSNLALGGMNAFVEAKYSIGGFNQLQLTFGVRF